RAAELRLLDEALASHDVSLVAFIGPGGQGKTGIVQHWLDQVAGDTTRVDGVFFWSFYRGKDADLCLRQLLADVSNAAVLPEASARFCVDRFLPVLRRRKWLLVLDCVMVV